MRGLCAPPLFFVSAAAVQARIRSSLREAAAEAGLSPAFCDEEEGSWEEEESAWAGKQGERLEKSLPPPPIGLVNICLSLFFFFFFFPCGAAMNSSVKERVKVKPIVTAVSARSGLVCFFARVACWLAPAGQDQHAPTAVPENPQETYRGRRFRSRPAHQPTRLKRWYCMGSKSLRELCASKRVHRSFTHHRYRCRTQV